MTTDNDFPETRRPDQTPDTTPADADNATPDAPDAPSSIGGGSTGRPGTDQDSLTRAVLHLSRGLMRHEHRTRHGDGRRSGRMGQGRVLAMLAAKAPMTQRELGYLLDIRPQSLAELLAKLEAKGLITRARDTKDRRSLIVDLTDQGRAAVPDPNAGSDVTDPFAVLTEEQRGSLADLLATITEHLIQTDGAPTDRDHRGGGRGEGRRRGEHHPHGGRGPGMPGFPGAEGARDGVPGGAGPVGFPGGPDGREGFPAGPEGRRGYGPRGQYGRGGAGRPGFPADPGLGRGPADRCEHPHGHGHHRGDCGHDQDGGRWA